jgi:tetratricopeptide (TPR) repeat protein
MEADGTRYLEAALSGNAKNAQDHCDRGRVYYYMDDYENATAELKQAIDGDNTEALALLGMVYMDQGDSANARTMFQQYVSQAENGAKGFNGLALCDIEDGDYDSALSNISSGIHVADAEDMQSLLFNEIAVYEKKLDFQTALQKANEYLGLYPDDKTVKKELAFLKTRVSGEDSSADSQLSD